MSEERRLSTRLLHADEGYRNDHIGPYISVSTSESFLNPVLQSTFSLRGLC